MVKQKPIEGNLWPMYLQVLQPLMQLPRCNLLPARQTWEMRHVAWAFLRIQVGQGVMSADPGVCLCCTT